ncbi:DoxX family protein [Chitinophaga sancti]|uniref:MauE/DoxX family redox-associated membrane protein n=1 Tax=Chitinophaga sancti TaxID=1004 RepID=UPI002A75E6CA|nr:DoxX family membrane protein [Chitinophaga sancti]WPQ61653.1 DoxX family protein [Chitinophaga sancti]
MKKIIFNILSVLFGLLLLNAGLAKFFHYMPEPKDLPPALIADNAAFKEISWLMPLVGIAEILGGILIIIPKTRALGAVVIFPVMVGVALTNITVAPGGLPMVAVIWAILLWIIFENWKKYLPMIR